MGILSFSPSKLEFFRKFIHEEYNGWFTRERVIDNIKGIQERSFKANLGTAIHEVLEKGYKPYYDSERKIYLVTVENRDEDVPNDIFEFNDNELAFIKQYYDTHKRVVNEIPLELKLKIQGNDVIMRMRLDQMQGISVTDHKTSDKEPKIDEFERSVQWKLYLLATGAKIFNYNHIQYKKLKKDIEYRLIPKSWQFYPYPEMYNDILGWGNRFINFCKIEGLIEYIQYKEPKKFEL